MADGALDPLLAVDEFYDYRGRLEVDEDAPPIWLPVHQGDVFEGVDVPGVPRGNRDESQLGMVFMHPCTMRRGALLTDLITVFQVRTESAKKHVDPARLMRWFSVMPLPDLRPGATSTHVADFLHIGVVPSLALDRTKRIASLSAAARQRVQQRVIYHLTRLAVPLHDLAMQTRAVERELELQASWCERACEHSSETADVVAEVNREIRQRYTNRPQ